MPTFKHEISAGGVIYRRVAAGVEVALTMHKDLAGKTVWSLPKGLLEPGESAEAAAYREVREETGLEGRIVQALGQSNYWYFSRRGQARIKKTVHFFLLECMGGDLAGHDWEVEEVRWFSLPDARRTLAYEGEREMLDRASAILMHP